ncbi:MAG: sigma 54-interacting transcriptional regulator [Acidobacteria bacterium]|jgi:transcriptional regulator with AAA-type ATPase domain|nr:sigma 54-interacting transcriptional regulator [Acidobacteriota bacterium]
MLIQSIKDSIWHCIKDKDVALFMIFSAEGEILWHRGRAVMGGTIAEGKGFCRSFGLEALKKRREVGRSDCLIRLNGNSQSESAMFLKIKQLLIFPVSDELFFYLDSGGNGPFLHEEIAELKTLGKIFSRLMADIRRKERGSEGLSGCSQAAELIRTKVRKYAIVEEPVLLFGETGVGKNRAAELIHKYSGRQGNFVHVHTPGVSRDLFESQIFGHRKGSFTGACADTFGFVAAAEGGTLFLDEIADLSPDVQAKLLRLIDARTYMRLGEAVERQADVRIVAATNQDLKRLIVEKLFREDLYFRLNVLPIVIPPLRERREDIPDLLEEFAGKLNGRKLGREAVRVLMNHSWPGNIRELNSVLTRAGINSEKNEINEEIEEFIEKDFPSANAIASGNSKLDGIRLELMGGKNFWEAVWDPFIDREMDRETVKLVLNKFYDENGHNFKKLLKTFNLKDEKYHTFMSLLHKYHLVPKR